MSLSVDVSLCRWDRLLGFLRRACPALGIYGGDTGGNAPKLIKLLKDDAVMNHVASELFKIDCIYNAATDPLCEKWKKADKDRRAAEDRLLLMLENTL